MLLARNYRYRLYPTPAQTAVLVSFAGARRYVWNWGLRRKQESYKATGKSPTYGDLARELTILKQQPDTTWLQESVNAVLQQSLRDLEQAFNNFFAKRTGYPRPKSRKFTPHSLRFVESAYIVNEALVRIPKIGAVRAVIHRPTEGVVKSATVKQETSGEWYIVFTCHIERPDFPPTNDNPVGIDLGLETFTTLSTGEKVKPPKFYRKGERRIKRAQRLFSRKQKGSKNRLKAKKRLAKIHNKISNQRKDWLHKHALGIVRRFDVVCIEDLNLKGLVRTKLAKSFSDAALGAFVQMLKEKAEWYGRRVVQVNRFYASSKTCHQCQTKTTLTLSDRLWTCHTCGTTHDRDVNAAINLLHEGVRILAAKTTER